MKIIIKFFDSDEIINISNPSPTDVEKHLTHLQKKEPIFIDTKGQWFRIENGKTTADSIELHISPTIGLFKEGDKVIVAQIGQPENAKFSRMKGIVIELIYSNIDGNRRKRGSFPFHYIVKVKLENGEVVGFFDTELQLLPNK